MKSRYLNLKPYLFNQKLTAKNLKFDLIAGINVGIIAIPLSLVLAIRAGISPSAGLSAAILASFIGAFTSGSNYQINGPTAALIATILTITSKYGTAGLFTSVFLGGLILMLSGFLGAGKLIKFVTPSIVSGFTVGIATVLFVGQIPDFLGINVQNSPIFIQKIKNIFSGGKVNTAAVITGLASFLTILFYPQKFRKFLPPSVAAIIIGLAIYYGFSPNIYTIGSKYGAIKLSFKINFSYIHFKSFKTLIFPALNLAFLCAVVSLLSARVGDSLSKQNHNPNTELISQGLINIGCAAMCLIPVTGAVARMGANVKAGAKTPLSQIFHALTILVVALFLTPILKDIPLASLAAILIAACKNMLNLKELKSYFKNSLVESASFIVTLALAVFAGLSFAVIGGMAFYFIQNGIHKVILLRQKKVTVCEFSQSGETLKIQGFLNYISSVNLNYFLMSKGCEIKKIDLTQLSALDFYGAKVLSSFINKNNTEFMADNKIAKLINNFN